MDWGRLGLSLQRALLGEVTPNLAGVTVGSSEDSIRIRAYFDGPPTAEDVERIQAIGSEVAADFPEAINVDVETLETQQRMETLDFWVFRRAP